MIYSFVSQGTPFLAFSVRASNSENNRSHACINTNVQSQTILRVSTKILTVATWCFSTYNVFRSSPFWWDFAEKKKLNKTPNNPSRYVYVPSTYIYRLTSSSFLWVTRLRPLSSAKTSRLQQLLSNKPNRFSENKITNPFSGANIAFSFSAQIFHFDNGGWSRCSFRFRTFLFLIRRTAQLGRITCTSRFIVLQFI